MKIEAIGSGFSEDEICRVEAEPLTEVLCPDCGNRLRQNRTMSNYLDCLRCEVQYEVSF